MSSRIPRAAAAEITAPGGPSTAWWGMAMLLASEAMLFGAFIASYFYLRLESAVWPPPGIPEPPVVVPLVLVVQSGYLAYELHSYAGDLDRFGPSDHAYASIYYVLLGADHAHVFVGLLFDMWLLLKLSRGLTRYRRRATQAIALYWHGVNLLTVVVIATILSARL